VRVERDEGGEEELGRSGAQDRDRWPGSTLASPDRPAQREIQWLLPYIVRAFDRCGKATTLLDGESGRRTQEAQRGGGRRRFVSGDEQKERRARGGGGGRGRSAAGEESR
jgi:hypothetical protein